jgi:hypothetical protein
MTAIIKNKFRLKNAKSFIESFEVPKNFTDLNEVSALTNSAGQQLINSVIARVPNRNHYLFVGKPFGWDTTVYPTNTNDTTELNPPVPVDTQSADKVAWDEMLGLKKITRGDVSLVIPRSDWRSGTIFATFDDADADLYRQPTIDRINAIRQDPTARAGNFYALNSLMELFICVDNNNNSASTVEPFRSEINGENSGITGRLERSDGYVWQYITTLSANEAVKFLTDSWIPVKTLPEGSSLGVPQEDVQANAIPGELLRVAVTAAEQTPGVFTHTYAGKVRRSVLDAEGKKLVIPNGDGNPTPSTVVDAYKGYELLIVDKQNNDAIISRHTITGYATIPDQELTLATAASELELNTSYDCEIIPLVVVQTNGEAVSVKPVLDAGGNITGVEVLEAGQNATSITMSVNRPATFTGNLPTLRPVLSPRLGLGKDPESDLGAFFVMVSTQLKYDEGDGDFPVANDYRQIGIIRDVMKKTKNANDEDVIELATDETLNATTIVNVRFETESKLGPSGLGFQPDDIVEIRSTSDVTQLIGKAKVVQFTKNETIGDLISGTLYLLQTEQTGYSTIEEGQSFVYSSGTNEVKGDAFSTPSTPSVPAVTNVELLKFHGDILYIENRRPVLRSIDQIEDIKTIIEF